MGINVVTLPPEKGGLGLTDVSSKCKALLIRRIIQLCHKCPDSALCMAIRIYKPQSMQVPIHLGDTHYKVNHITLFLLEISYLRMKSSAPLHDLTTAQLYRLMNDSGRVNRMELKYPDKDWTVIWKNINNKVLDTDIRSTWYKIVNETIPTRKKLHKIHLSVTDECRECHLIDTLQHRFVCGENKLIWERCRKILASVCRTAPQHISLMSVLKPDGNYYPIIKKNTWTWLVGHTLHHITSAQDKASYSGYRVYLATRAQLLEKGANYRKRFANYITALQITKI